MVLRFEGRLLSPELVYDEPVWPVKADPIWDPMSLVDMATATGREYGVDANCGIDIDGVAGVILSQCGEAALDPSEVDIEVEAELDCLFR